MAGTTEWWMDGERNNLGGIPSDGVTINTAILPDHFIVDFLRRIPAARDSFERLVPTMSPEEQTRLQRLWDSAMARELSDSIRDDRFQNRWNRQGVRTAGRYGGTRKGGNR